MRAIMCALCCLAAPAVSETITVRSAPSAVVVYFGAAKVTREFTVSLSAGRHDVILPDLPSVVEYVMPQIQVSNAVLGPVSVRSGALPPLSDPDGEVITAARELVNEKENALAEHFDKEAGIQAETDAAEAQIEFLKSLGQNEGLSSDATNLGEVATMIGGQMLLARKKILETDKRVRDMADARENLEEELLDAKEALAALLTADEDRVQAVFSLSTDVDVNAEVIVSYFAPARWTPQYDVVLSKVEPASLAVRRGASVEQESGEDWIDVKMSLSTLQVADGLAPFDIQPRRLWLSDPSQPLARAQVRDRGSLVEPVVEAPVIVEEAASASIDYDGPGVTYEFPNVVTVANEVEATRVAFDTVVFPATVFARAVPFYDDTAFLMARFQNTSAEPLFEVQEALFSVENRFVGVESMPEVPVGEEGVLAFGPVEALRLERDILDRKEGDGGIINRFNEQNEEIRIKVSNVGSEEWDVELIDRVPYSEQEDLIVSFSSDPEPDQQDFELQRGVLMWGFKLPPGKDKLIEIQQNIRWPEDKFLR